MPVDEDDLFEDELDDEDESEDEEEYEYEDLDDEDDADEGFEEFEDDFASGPAEVKVKTVPGMDTFALGWAFSATLLAVCVATWVILYEVYDWNAVFDLLPEKERPNYPSEFEVLGIGRDDSVSDGVNYVVIDRGRNSDITPGTLIEILPPADVGSNWVMRAIVSEECLGDVAKAWIVEVRPRGGAEPPDGQQLVSATTLGTYQEDTDLAMRNIWLARGAPGEDTDNLRGRVVEWGQQPITRATQIRQFPSR